MPRSEPPRRIDAPEPGYFRVRLRARAWAVPAQIVHQDGLWWAVVNGEAHPPHPDPALAPQVMSTWTSGARIEEHEYRWLLALRDAAAHSDPDHPALHPTRRISPALLRPIIPRQRTPR